VAWRLFNWGSRGPTYDAGNGVYMAGIFINQCVQVNVQGIDGVGDELEHVFHVAVTNDLPTYDDCLAVADAVGEWYGANYIGILPTVIKGVQIVATSAAELDGPQATHDLAFLGGLVLLAPLPSSVTLCIKKSTGLSGRRHRGRFYTWPAWVAVIVESEFLDTYAASVIGCFLALKATLTAIGAVMVVRSLATPGGNLFPITNFVVVDLHADSQRRRLPGRGR
jgi:hypothetical protein